MEECLKFLTFSFDDNLNDTIFTLRIWRYQIQRNLLFLKKFICYFVLNIYTATKSPMSISLQNINHKFADTNFKHQPS